MSSRFLDDVVDRPNRKCEADGHRSDSQTDEQSFPPAQRAHIQITSHISLRNGPSTTVRCARACHHSVVVNGIAFAAEPQLPVIAELFGLIVRPTQRWTSHSQPDWTAYLKARSVDFAARREGITPVTNIYVLPVKPEAA
jgi:hypothetical protein